MLSNTFLRRAIARSISKRNYSGPEIKASYNDVPSPQGSWQTAYDANQRKYNAHLAFGVLFAVGTITFAKAGGYLYLNFNPPARPAE